MTAGPAVASFRHGVSSALALAPSSQSSIAMSLRPLLRASLPATRPAPGFGSFSLPCKKLILEYCETWGSSAGARAFIELQSQPVASTSASSNTPKSGLASLADRNPGVEFLLKRRPFKHPVLRGHYREFRSSKEISLTTLGSGVLCQTPAGCFREIQSRSWKIE